MRIFYLEAFGDDIQKAPKGVALQAFVRTCGDTVGVVFVKDDGTFELWRDGGREEVFPNPASLFAYCNGKGY